MSISSSAGYHCSEIDNCFSEDEMKHSGVFTRCALLNLLFPFYRMQGKEVSDNNPCWISSYSWFRWQTVPIGRAMYCT